MIAVISPSVGTVIVIAVLLVIGYFVWRSTRRARG
jgi:hypothetical protein